MLTNGSVNSSSCTEAATALHMSAGQSESVHAKEGLLLLDHSRAAGAYLVPEHPGGKFKLASSL